MKVKHGDIISDIEVFKIIDNGPKKVSLKELFINKKILLIGVPGAFTPTCAKDHIPEFISNIENFHKKGIDDIFVISVNDPFVMDSWISSYGENNINYIADPNGDFIKETGLELDLSSIGLGVRLSRFAMLINNCEIKKIFDEEGGGLDKSKAGNVLGSI